MMKYETAPQIRKAMTRDKLMISLSVLKEKLEDESVTFREIKALYFSINFDYIRLCEVIKNGSYFPSKRCDILMRNCINESNRNEAMEIVKTRIQEISKSLS